MCLCHLGERITAQPEGLVHFSLTLDLHPQVPLLAARALDCTDRQLLKLAVVIFSRPFLDFPPTIDASSNRHHLQVVMI